MSKKQYGYDFNKNNLNTKKFRQKKLYNIISMIILNNYETVISLCTDNHNVILNVSDRSVEKFASPDKILESKTS